MGFPKGALVNPFFRFPLTLPSSSHHLPSYRAIISVFSRWVDRITELPRTRYYLTASINSKCRILSLRVESTFSMSVGMGNAARSVMRSSPSHAVTIWTTNVLELVHWSTLDSNDNPPTRTLRPRPSFLAWACTFASPLYVMHARSRLIGHNSSNRKTKLLSWLFASALGEIADLH